MVDEAAAYTDVVPAYLQGRVRVSFTTLVGSVPLLDLRFVPESEISFSYTPFRRRKRNKKRAKQKAQRMARKANRK